MGGRVYCAAREDGFIPRYFEIEAYHPTECRVYKLDIPLDELMQKLEQHAALLVVKPGHKIDTILQVRSCH